MARFYKLLARRRTVFYVICFALFTAFFCAVPAYAGTTGDAAFTVKGVEVDVTAESAAAAREQAFTEAQKQAFSRLTERLLSEQQLAAFVIPDVSVISALIKDFEVTQERLSSVRYIGTYTFRFKNDAVRNYLSMEGLAYTDVSSKPVLVLPYYQWGSRTLLWGADNPWLMAWNKMQSYQGLVPVIVPIGDLQDVADIGDNEALTYSAESLEKMTARYGAGEAIIMLAVPEWTGAAGARTGAPPDRLTIMVYRTDRGAPEFANKIVVGAENGDVFENAVRKVRKSLQQAWKSQTMVNPMQGNNLKVRVRFNDMQEWVETQKALRRVQGINDMKLLSLKPNEAHVELIFQGSESRLRLALAQADMTLSSPRINFNRPTQYPTDYNGYRAGYNPYGDRNGQPHNTASPLTYDLYLNKYKRYRDN